MTPDAQPPPTPAAERRLDEHLELLRHRVVRTARWQRAVRVPLQVAATVVGAVIDGLRVLVGGRRGSQR
jgi:hypothetical protein